MTLLAAALLAALVLPAGAQQKDKKKKKDANAASDNQPIIPMPDEQAIDYMISSMLGAWQLGDVERLHQTYADDVMIVSGVWAPPVVGWANYAALYQLQRAQMKQVRVDRTNSYIKVEGLVAWTCYQWQFSGVVDGQPMSAQGQTTLIMEKRNNRWLIVHNHTSASPLPPAAPQNPATGTPSTEQPPASKPPTR
jgi:ketosteroid isomerase-like protein